MSEPTLILAAIAAVRASQATLEAANAQLEAVVIGLKALQVEGDEPEERPEPGACPECGKRAAPAGYDGEGRPEFVCPCGKQFSIAEAA